jgi:ATP-binding cassette, subfamily B, bacterial
MHVGHRFYDCSRGQVFIDGIDIRELDPCWIHEHVALVGQEPVLFAMSIADNIRYGRPSATPAQVEAAARLANAHDFITAFPDGFSTLVGERGVRLSGGQKQRIAIARAMLVNPRVLLLDEATSALDAESEHLVQEAMDRAMAGRTVIIIAHRLSTVRSASCLLVMEHGRIVERGTHDHLIAARGVYFRLVERQMSLTPDE